MEVATAMAERIDTAVDEEQPAAPQPALDQPPAKTGLEQLPTRNRSVLSFGQVEDQPGRRVRTGACPIRSDMYLVANLMGR
jgi:hypothetical protein